ncbi:MAG: UDP-4-amino-4,6-dideoxy-N-acetyl-beta-L-altrosamine transaminase [Thermoanaerobaculia bacterium]
MLPYARQWIDDDDVDAVVEVLRSDWLTTGPAVDRFEERFAETVGARHAVAVSHGTAALHAAVHALGIGAGDEVVVPAMTFAATANCVVYEGGTPVFADVEPDTLLLDPASVEARLTPRTRAVLTVDYAGRASHYDELAGLCAERDLSLVADACHALGARHRGRPVGSLARLSTFSFHPVKHVATGEGGMITTDEADLAASMRRFRNHGITTDHRQRAAQGAWHYEMVELGYNYRLTDLQCALGLSQLEKLPRFLARRRELAARYDAAFAEDGRVRPLDGGERSEHAYHLYVVRLAGEAAGRRDEVFAGLRERGIGANVHYIPVHLHPYYRGRFGTEPVLCPVAEAAYRDLLTLPLFPAMADEDVDRVVGALRECLEALS